jgi:hypothetical protein
MLLNGIYGIMKEKTLILSIQEWKRKRNLYNVMGYVFSTRCCFYNFKIII